MGRLKENLCNDIIFRFIFGNKKNERILISLLNSILGLEGSGKIIKLTFLNPINLKEYLKDKTTTLDVKAEDNTGKLYNIEVQVRYHTSYIERVLYYLAKLFSSQLKNAESYQKLNKTIGISILDFELLENEPDIHNIYRYLNVKTKRELSDIQELHFIELPKFKKDKPHSLRSPFEKWLHVLKLGEQYKDKLDNLPKELAEEEEIVMALREMVRAVSDPVVRELMEHREKALHDEATRMEDAIEYAKAEGKTEGELNKSINIAKKALAKGYDIEEVSDLTGLPVEQIQKLMSEN